MHKHQSNSIRKRCAQKKETAETRNEQSGGPATPMMVRASLGILPALVLFKINCRSANLARSRVRVSETHKKLPECKQARQSEEGAWKSKPNNARTWKKSSVLMSPLLSVHSSSSGLFFFGRFSVLVSFLVGSSLHNSSPASTTLRIPCASSQER